MILGDRSHIFLNEAGGMSALGGIVPHIIPNDPGGALPLNLIEKAIRTPDIHHAPTRLICLENTHNYCQGAPLTPGYMKEVARLAHSYSLKIHLDGARIFNAAIALKVGVEELTKEVDSVMFCLSKGLSAPAGSLVCGKRGFIQTARRMRKMLGGGMRQAGHLAAAGLVAMQSQVAQLQTDHQNAQELALGLESIAGVDLDIANVRTNIVFFSLNHARIKPDEFLLHLSSQGVKLLMIDPGVFRAVTHRNISRDQIQKALEVVRKLLA